MHQHPFRRAALPTLAISGLLASMAVVAPVSAATGDFTNPAAITVDDDGQYVQGTNDTDIVLGEPTGPGSPSSTTINLDAPADARVNDIHVYASLTHENMDDVDLMLVSPSGHAVTLLSDAGGANPSSGYVRFYDWEEDFPNDSVRTYGYPTDWDDAGDTDTFPAPAPATAPASFDQLYGTPTAGAWTLYAVDDADGSAGVVSDWSIYVYSMTSASPSPSTLAVAGLPNSITDVDLSLHDLDMASLRGLEVVLESPDGRRAHVMSDAGGYETVENLNLTLDDEASAPLRRGVTPTSGSYQPVDYDYGDTSEYVGGSDTKNLSSLLSTFDGANPNGTWKLYVVVQGYNWWNNEEQLKSISGGWSLRIATADATPTPVITSPTHGFRDNDGAVTLTGTAKAGSLVKVTVGTKSRNTVADGGTWSVTFDDLREGSRTFTATATDSSGNVSAPATVTVTVDTVDPRVAKISPKHHATGVARSVSPTVKFNEAMNVRSVKRSVKLVVRDTGKLVAAKLSYSTSKNTVTINPKNNLANDTMYRVVVKKTVKDLAGNTMRKAKKDSFTTS